MKPRYVFVLAPFWLALIVVVTGLLCQVGSTHFQLWSMLEFYYGCIIIYATHARWPLMIAKEDEDKWYTWMFSLNHRGITRLIGTTGLIVWSYFWGAMTIVIAVMTWRAFPWHSSIMRSVP
jgi:hypothetical protein